MQKRTPPMTREQMQGQALIIDSYLLAVQALINQDEISDALYLIESAQDRASKLNGALDGLYAEAG